MQLYAVPKRQLGFWDMIAEGLASSAMKSGGSGSGGAGGTAVTTTTNVTVSPQISPQFIQQQSPSGSPITAGVNPLPQPGLVPVAGAMPGFDYAGGFLPGTTMPLFASVARSAMNPLIIAVLIGGAAAFYFKRKKTSSRAKRRQK